MEDRVMAQIFLVLLLVNAIFAFLALDNTWQRIQVVLVALSVATLCFALLSVNKS